LNRPFFTFRPNHPLSRPAYRRLFAGQAMSDFANWLDFLALSAVIVYAWGHGAFALAALSVCIGLPWVVVGPWCSFRVGRFSGRAVLVACDAFRALILLSMLWADTLPVLLTLVFLKMCASSVFDPVRQSGVKRVVEPDQYALASALSHMCTNATKIVAPMLGGLVIAVWDVKTPFLICAVLYAASALALARLPDWRDAVVRSDGRFREQMRSALDYIRTRRTLALGIGYMSAVMFLLFLYDGLFVLFTERLGLGEASLGFLMSGIGAGSVAGSLLAGRWTSWQQAPLTVMARFGALSGLFVALVGVGAFDLLTSSLWFWTPFFVLMGICGSMGAVPFGYILQAETTEETIAPVSALANALQTGMMLIAPALGAALAAWVGVGGVFVSAGLVMSALALWFGRSRPASSPGLGSSALLRRERG